MPKRKLVQEPPNHDPLAITEADLRRVESPAKKKKSSVGVGFCVEKTVAFRNGRFEVVDGSKKGKKENKVVFATAASKKYIPATPSSSSRSNTTPKSILKQQKGGRTGRKAAVPSRYREDSSSDSSSSVPLRSLGKYKKQPSVVLSNYFDDHKPNVVLKSCKNAQKNSKSSPVPVPAKKPVGRPRKDTKVVTPPKKKQAAKPEVGVKKAGRGRPRKEDSLKKKPVEAKKTVVKNSAKTAAKNAAKKAAKKAAKNAAKKKAKMLLKRNRRIIRPIERSPSPSPKKAKVTRKSNVGPKSRTMRKFTLGDYVRLMRKYKKLLPETEPVVRLRRLTFKASHHSGEPYRLPSDVDLIRDSATFYDILGIIMQNLDTSDRYKALGVCRLWNKAGREEKAWKKLIFRSRVITNLKPLERLILKHDTEVLDFDDVEVPEEANKYEFCRLSSVRNITCSSTDPSFLENLLLGCNELEHLKILKDENVEVVKDASSTLKTLIAPAGRVDMQTSRKLKRFGDLETLSLCTFEPDTYNVMGLLVSLKRLSLTYLHITSEIQNFFETIPNIEYLSFSPIYASENVFDSDINRELVEGLKRCPSLKKLEWITIEEEVVVRKKEVPVPVKEDTPVPEEEPQPPPQEDPPPEPMEASEPVNSQPPEELLSQDAPISEQPPDELLKLAPEPQPPSESNQTVEELPSEAQTPNEPVEPMETDAPEVPADPETAPEAPLPAEEPPKEPETGTEEAKEPETEAKEPETEAKEPSEINENGKSEGEEEKLDDTGFPDDDLSDNEVKSEPMEQDEEEEEEESKKDVKPQFAVAFLKKIAFISYLTSSLPECHINFRIVKKYIYVDEKDELKDELE